MDDFCGKEIIKRGIKDYSDAGNGATAASENWFSEGLRKFAAKVAWSWSEDP
jgi:hypothetical protein